MNLLEFWVIGCVLVIINNNFAASVQSPKPIWNATYTDKLRQDLLLNYDKFARPAQHYNSTSVKFGLTARHFDINEMKSSFTLHCFVKLVWQDEKLKWNKSDYGNISSVHLADHEIWQPDIFAYNSATAQAVNNYGNTPAILYEQGDILWVPPAQFTVLCELDLTYWPFDTQTCKMIFGSWTYHGGQIDLKIFNDDTEITDKHLVDSHEWKYISSTAKVENIKYDCCEEKYPSVEYNITLQRVSSSYNAVVVSPALAVILLILMTFWLPPQAGEKIILQGITAIIIVLYLLYFAQKLPAMGTNTPLIVLFYSHALYIVCLSMIGSITVIWLARTSHSQHLPWRIKQLLIGPVGKGLCLGHYIAQTTVKHQVNSEDTRDHHGNNEIGDSDQHIMDDDHRIIDTNNSHVNQQDWILLAAAVDRVLFCFYSVLFAILAIAYSL